MSGRGGGTSAGAAPSIRAVARYAYSSSSCWRSSLSAASWVRSSWTRSRSLSYFSSFILISERRSLFRCCSSCTSSSSSVIRMRLRSAAAPVATATFREPGAAPPSASSALVSSVTSSSFCCSSSSTCCSSSFAAASSSSFAVACARAAASDVRSSASSRRSAAASASPPDDASAVSARRICVRSAACASRSACTTWGDADSGAPSPSSCSFRIASDASDASADRPPTVRHSSERPIVSRSSAAIVCQLCASGRYGQSLSCRQLCAKRPVRWSSPATISTRAARVPVAGTPARRLRRGQALRPRHSLRTPSPRRSPPSRARRRDALRG